MIEPGQHATVQFLATDSKRTQPAPALNFQIIKKISIAIGFLTAALNVSAQNEPEPGQESLFGLDSVVDIHLVIESEEWAKLQPAEDTDWDIYKAFGRIDKDAKAGRHYHSDRSSRPGLAGYLGVDHAYGKGKITIDDESVDDVGIRYKGNGTFLEGREHGKYSFKIDFNEFDDDQEFRGLTKINLQNNVSDPSFLREALSYEIFREAGIHCPRLGWARVTLTVPGVIDDEELGVYGLVEQVGKRFLKDRYGSSKGLLLKPSTFGTFRHFGNEWEPYEAAYFPKTKGSDEQKRKLIDFSRLLQESNDQEFDQRIESFLDTDQFLRFLAINVLLSNLDSFLGGTQNYYAYLDPGTDQFQLLPWDLDHSFGSFDLVGNPESRRDLSIHAPHWGSNRLIERMLAIPRYKEAYHQILEDYLVTVFAQEKLGKQIAETAAFLRPVVAKTERGRDSLRKFDRIVAADPSGSEHHALNLFVARRHASLKKQLAGESAGRVLKMGGLPDFKKMIPVLAICAIALLLNVIAWVWAVAVGFRGSVLWGVFNLLLFPITPLIYGFGIRKDLGKRAAIATLASSLVLACAIVYAVWVFENIVQ
ncbi:MAG: spore coat protein H [Verrucomicrobiales bacterium]|jgi:spore coat protein H